MIVAKSDTLTQHILPPINFVRVKNTESINALLYGEIDQSKFNIAVWDPYNISNEDYTEMLQNQLDVTKSLKTFYTHHDVWFYLYCSHMQISELFEQHITLLDPDFLLLFPVYIQGKNYDINMLILANTVRRLCVEVLEGINVSFIDIKMGCEEILSKIRAYGFDILFSVDTKITYIDAFVQITFIISNNVFTINTYASSLSFTLTLRERDKLVFDDDKSPDLLLYNITTGEQLHERCTTSYISR